MKRKYAPRKRYEFVAEALAEAIGTGRYLPAEKLPSERELAETHDTSRPTVREALIALQLRGLVEARPNMGFYVARALPATSTSLDHKFDFGAFELAEARRLIEGEAAALAAKTISDDECARLDELIEAMRKNNENNMVDETPEREFHMIIARAARNAPLALFIDMLWEWRTKSLLTQEMWRRARLLGSVPLLEDHVVIAAAMKARDPAAARRAVLTHMTNVIEELLTATEMEEVERTKARHNELRSELLQRAALSTDRG